LSGSRSGSSSKKPSATASKRRPRFGNEGADVEGVSLPEKFGGLAKAQETILQTLLARSLSHESKGYPDRLSDTLNKVIERGDSAGMDEYMRARRLTAECRGESAGLFQGHHVLLAPSVKGEAPEGLETTGDPLFCQMWTLLGLPCVSAPGIWGPNGLPLGAQIIGPMY
jgi:Asp-tRNA(Asn)/Glu-tRNA(Gln) amidotransferase A subunit family amidase